MTASLPSKGRTACRRFAGCRASTRPRRSTRRRSQRPKSSVDALLGPPVRDRPSAAQASSCRRTAPGREERRRSSDEQVHRLLRPFAGGRRLAVLEHVARDDAGEPGRPHSRVGCVVVCAEVVVSGSDRRCLVVVAAAAGRPPRDRGDDQSEQSRDRCDPAPGERDRPSALLFRRLGRRQDGRWPRGRRIPAAVSLAERDPRPRPRARSPAPARQEGPVVVPRATARSARTRSPHVA